MWARGKWKEGMAVSQQNARKCYLVVEKDRQEPSCLLTGGVCRARVGDDGKFYIFEYVAYVGLGMFDPM